MCSCFLIVFNWYHENSVFFSNVEIKSKISAFKPKIPFFLSLTPEFELKFEFLKLKSKLKLYN